MHVFITGATGQIGTPVVRRLIAAGHTVPALARRPEAESRVAELSAIPVAGSLTDVEVLRHEAQAADAIVHLAADWADPDITGTDHTALQALLDGAGNREIPFIYTSSTLALGNTGPQALDEDAPQNPNTAQPFKVPGERLTLATPGVRGTIMRPGAVHGGSGHLLVQGLFAMARESLIVPYVDAGENRWSTIHTDDLAELYLSAIEDPRAHGILHATSDHTFSMRELAEAIAQRTGAPATSISLERATEIYGPFATVLTYDLLASSARARDRFTWTPSGITIFDEIAATEVLNL